MRSTFHARLRPALALALLVPLAAAQEKVETRYDDGTIHERYTLDAAGRKSGAYEEYRPDGSLLRRRTYVADVLNGRAEDLDADGKTVLSSGSYRGGEQDGAWVFFSPETARRKKVQFEHGIVDGTVTIQVENKTISRQKWKDGELQELDGLKPFPVAAAAVRARLAAVLAEPEEPVDAGADPLAALRAAGLRRLMAYRDLCGLPYQTMRLVPEWNALCDAAAHVCRLNGKISHTPPRPPDVDDELYRRAQEGASHSNLSAGTDLPGSIDGYMNDSDPSNIDRIGHRRWCLNPLLEKTGLGLDSEFSAMWSMDESGRGVRGMEAVLYPPVGWCPVDFFSPSRAFSISLLRGGIPKKEDLRASVRPFDADWVPGEPLELDHLAMAEGDFGHSPCIVFRPVGLIVRSGASYLVEVSTDGGRSNDFRYVVAFCEPVVERK